MSNASIASIGILPSSTIRSTHYCPRSRKSNGEKGGRQLTHRKRLLGRSCPWTRIKMIQRASSLVGNLSASSPSLILACLTLLRTYVFTLDSLGARHPKVVTVLGQYLQYEARERKGIAMDQSSKPTGKHALVSSMRGDAEIFSFIPFRRFHNNQTIVIAGSTCCILRRRSFLTPHATIALSWCVHAVSLSSISSDFLCRRERAIRTRWIARSIGTMNGPGSFARRFADALKTSQTSGRGIALRRNYR